jgi:hypothetical protein
MTIPEELREYAEVPDRFAPIPEGSSVTRHDDGRVCVIQGTTWASVTGVRVGEDDVDALVDEVRALVAPEKHCTWWLSPSVQPADLVERLKACGFTVPKDRVATVKALVLTEPPEASTEGIEVRRITTFDEFEASKQVQWDAFEVSEDRRAQQRKYLHADFEESQRTGVPVCFLAKLHGRPAATGMAIPADRGLFLIAGSTAPWARGRGLYRALVHARWRFAVERGTPALVTQADPSTSYPILKRLGFQDVCTIDRLEDPRGS